MLATFTGATRGEEIQELVVATVRSVSNGVVGVAFLQALALGIGFLILGVPAAGLLALLVLFLGVLQLPQLYRGFARHCLDLAGQRNSHNRGGGWVLLT